MPWTPRLWLAPFLTLYLQEWVFERGTQSGYVSSPPCFMPFARKFWASTRPDSNLARPALGKVFNLELSRRHLRCSLGSATPDQAGNWDICGQNGVGGAAKFIFNSRRRLEGASFAGNASCDGWPCIQCSKMQKNDESRTRTCEGLPMCWLFRLRGSTLNSF